MPASLLPFLVLAGLVVAAVVVALRVRRRNLAQLAASSFRVPPQG
jgi:hypothetical protein